MSTEANKALIRHFFDSVNAGKFDVAEEVYSQDTTTHNPMPPPEEFHGLAAMKQLMAGYVAAFPDMKFTIEEMVAEADMVVTRYKIQATHRGELMGFAPTNRLLTLRALVMHRIAGGKIVEEWEHYDTYYFMRQIGAIPAAAQQAE